MVIAHGGRIFFSSNTWPLVGPSAPVDEDPPLSHPGDLRDVGDSLGHLKQLIPELLKEASKIQNNSLFLEEKQNMNDQKSFQVQMDEWRRSQGPLFST